MHVDSGGDNEFNGPNFWGMAMVGDDLWPKLMHHLSEREIIFR